VTDSRSTRRMFLRTASGLALGLPFLPSLLPRTVKAADFTAPKRFIAVCSQSGVKVADFWPAWTPPGYELRDEAYGGERSDGTTALHTTMPGTTAKWAPLDDFTSQPLSTVITDELAPYYSKMLLLRGLDYLQGTSHGTGTMLGNYANCANTGGFEPRGLGRIPTIDQVLAYSDKFYPIAPRARSIQLATGSPGSISDTDYGVPGGLVETLTAYLEPHDLWEDLFGDLMDPKLPKDHPNRKLLNSVYDDYSKLKLNARLSADDKAALDRHMQFLSDIEAGLSGSVSAACVTPTEPPVFGVGFPWQEVSSVEDFETWTQLLVDIACAAVRCDLTRIVTFQAQMGVSDATGEKVNSYHSSADVVGDWHDYAHDAGPVTLANDHLQSINRWVCTHVYKRFLEELDVEEGEGQTFLDNSIVYFANELAMDHYTLALPTILAGSAGGQLDTGHYVDYSQLDGDYANDGIGDGWGVLIPGVPHNRLLVTILQAMGLSPEDYEIDGKPGYGHTEFFFEPYQLPESSYVAADYGKPLPGIFLG
jgi:Protein of unknown function (DUF1552)